MGAHARSGPAYAGPTLVVAGRLDSTVGYAAAADLVDHYPHATLAVVDDAGHALPHEQPDLLRALVAEWLARVERSVSRASAASGPLSDGRAAFCLRVCQARFAARLRRRCSCSASSRARSWARCCLLPSFSARRCSAATTASDRTGHT